MENMIHDGDENDDYITVSVGDMHAWILEAMIALSDGLSWHPADNPEDEKPLVMASPSECADAAVYGVLIKLSEELGIDTDKMADADGRVEFSD
jgi:hypothetical protein